MKPMSTSNPFQSADDELLPEYRFDYAKAKPNRFANCLNVRQSTAVIVPPYQLGYTADMQPPSLPTSATNATSLGSISHSFEDESQEAKARWFQSLTLEERMDMLCMFTDMILSVNPTMMERKHVKPIAGRVRVLTRL